MKSKSMCTTVGLVAMCLAGSAAAAGKPLYQTGPALSRSAAATATAEPSLQRVLSSPSTANAQVVQIDAGAVAPAEKLLELQLDGQTITATQAKVDALEGGDSIWYGNLGPRAGTRARTLSGVDPLNSAILVRSGDTVTGTIRYAGKLYRLRPLADGRHVLVQVDEQRMPQEHPAEYSLLPKFDMPNDGRVTAAQASSGSPATSSARTSSHSCAVFGAVNACSCTEPSRKSRFTARGTLVCWSTSMRTVTPLMGLTSSAPMSR